VTFVPADYRSSILIAAGDISAEFSAADRLAPGLLEHVNLRAPDIVRDAAGRFLDGGAEVLVTLTDGANDVAAAESLASGELTADQVIAMNRQGAELCRQAVLARRGSSAFVFGAIGPVEGLLTLSEVSEDALLAAYSAQAEALVAGGVDAVLCRSFTEMKMLRIAVEAARKVVDVPIIGSMTFDSGADYTETVMGVSVPSACAELLQAGVAVIGCDRSAFPDSSASVVSLLRDSCDLPIWVEVDAGRPEFGDPLPTYPETPEQFAARLEPLAGAGACFIGGGRGATAAHIAAIAGAGDHYLRRTQRRKP
jgi:methionine synthase I (cobalamin-dependent)